jgi:hypothetical protein
MSRRAKQTGGRDSVTARLLAAETVISHEPEGVTDGRRMAAWQIIGKAYVGVEGLGG